MAIKYPLLQVLDVKIRRVEEAERVVQQKRDALAKEQEKLAQREKEKEKVQKHHDAKLSQMREEMDRGTTSPKIQQMKAYIKVVKENVKIEEKKVKEQKEQVELAEKQLQMALHDLKLKRIEVDKLKMHKKDWEKEIRREEEIKEENEFNEQGAVIFSIRKKQRGNV